MKPESARALLWIAGILFLVGLMVISPAARFLSVVLAALAAVAPAVSGTRSTRIAGCVMLVAAIALAVMLFPGFKKEHQSYVERVKNNALPTQPPVQRK